MSRPKCPGNNFYRVEATPEARRDILGAPAPLNGCMCQDGTCGSCNRVAEAFEAVREALRSLRDWCDSELNGCPPLLAAAMERADVALALADEAAPKP